MDFVWRERRGDGVINVLVHICRRAQRCVTTVDKVLVFDDELIGFVEQ